MNFPKLSALPFNALDDPNLRRRTIEVLNALISGLRLEEGSWTAIISGSATAGTYEIATQFCRYTRIGRRIWLDLYIIMAAAVTGGGTGTLNITGVPYSKAANSLPQGAIFTDGINFVTTGATISLSFTSLTAGSILFINESADNIGNGAVPISGIGASDRIFASICYETDDP